MDHAHGSNAHAGHAHSPMGFTGERVLPDDPEWAWCFQAHKFGYDDLCARIPSGARIADIGCGAGYGAAMLSSNAAFMVASDVSEEAVRYARARYPDAAIAWLVCDAQRLPFAPSTFDVISSLQVIEHFRDTDQHLSGIARALKHDGWHYVATPNIDKMGEAEKDNEFHLRDFTPSELNGALTHHFGVVELLGMFYAEDSPRALALKAAEDTEETLRLKLERIERFLLRLPGPLRVRARPLFRRAIGVRAWPLPEARRARNAIRAEDFVARAPASESFCLIGIARDPRVR